MDESQHAAAESLKVFLLAEKIPGTYINISGWRELHLRIDFFKHVKWKVSLTAVPSAA